jgi:hypothetical protein
MPGDERSSLIQEDEFLRMSLTALTPNPSPVLGEGSQICSPSPLVGEGARGCSLLPKGWLIFTHPDS